MKNINFINTMPPHKQRELRTWFTITAVLMCVSILALLYLVLPRVYALYQLKKRYKTFSNNVTQQQPFIARKHELQKEHTALAQQMNTINTLTNSLKNMHTQLNAIMHACGSTMHLHTLTMEHEQLRISAYCANAQVATQFVRQLSAHPHMHNLHIVSLQPTQQAQGYNLLATIKGTLRK